jgi:hypothetical protein
MNHSISGPANGNPFHSGEKAVQARLGVQERMLDVGRRVIRAYLPDQHREFYAQLPFVLVGSVDALGRPWASVLVGEPGFMQFARPHAPEHRRRGRCPVTRWSKAWCRARRWAFWASSCTRGGATA